MPFKRTYRRKKRVYRRKRRLYKRKLAIRRPMGRNYAFVRGGNFTSIVISNSADTFYGYSFALSDLPNYTEFTNLFDEYRIVRVSMRFMRSRIQVNNTATITVPYFLSLVDKDDSAAPASYNEMLQHPDCRIKDCSRNLYLSFVPRFSMNIYNGVTDAYGSRVGWIDCSNASVPHYGVKIGFGTSAAANQYSYIVWFKYKVLCRGLR